MLVTDRQTIQADGQDVAVVEVRIVDRDGRIVPTASDEVAFRLEGSGTIIGVGNGDPASHEPDKAQKRRAFNGLCAVILQSTRAGDRLRLEATAAGREPGELTLTLERRSRPILLE